MAENQQRNDDGRRGPHIEVTIQSIHGISWKSEKNQEDLSPRNVKASVAFKGSAPAGMRVTSFTLSGRTGELVVQSNPMELEQEEKKKNEESVHNDSSLDEIDVNEHSLTATFNDPLATSSPMSSSSSSSASSSSQSQAHLKIEVPNCRPSLSIAHGDGGDFVACTRTPESPPKLEAASDDSNSITPEPPIAIEIHVCLESDHEELIQEGVAHLLLRCDEHFGTTSFDLPIESTTKDGDHSTKNSSVFFHPSDARLRVQIELGNDEHPCNKIDLKLSEQLDEIQMNGIVERIRHHDALLTKHAANKDNDASGTNNNQKHVTAKPFCGEGGGELGTSFQAFFDIFGCRRSTRNVKTGRQSNHFGMLRTNSTMATTIATRESLGI